MLKDGAKYVFGIALAVALMAWVLRGTDPATLWEQLKSASIGGLLLGASLNLGHNVFRVLRWRVLLEPTRAGLPFRSLFSAILIGYMTSWVVPGRLGELVRPMLVSARESVPLGPALGSVVADRVLDIVSVAFLFGVGMLITPLTGEAAEYAVLLRSGAVLMTLGGIVVLAVMVSVAIAGERCEAWIDRQAKLIRWIGRATLSVSRGAVALRSPVALIAAVFYGLLAWLLIAAGTLVCVRACGAELSLGATFIIMPMLVLGVAVPTPGGAGSYHGAMRTGLMLFGVSQLTAVTAGLLTHAMITIPIIVVGVLLLWIEKVKWSDLLAGAREIKRLGGETRSAEGLS